jgi:hypothetical protein
MQQKVLGITSNCKTTEANGLIILGFGLGSFEMNVVRRCSQKYLIYENRYDCNPEDPEEQKFYPLI